MNELELNEDRELTVAEWQEGLRLMAEDVVKIPQGQMVGRWSREDRVAIVYAVLCGLARKQGVPLPR